jgi:transcription initiation factor IIE alpha subunit
VADDKKLNIRKVIDDHAQVSDLNRLAHQGVNKVKVLDERTLLEMIERAVDEAISTKTAEERSQILADSRKQLAKLMGERDAEISKAKLAEAGREELLQKIDKLQTEIKLRREVDEQASALARKAEEMTEENAWLRKNNDKLVEELDQAQSEIKRLLDENAQLREELERMRARLGAENEELKQQLDDLRQGAATAGNAVKHELDRAREQAARLEKELREKTAAARDVDSLRARLAQAEAAAEEAREEARDVGESAKVKLGEAREEIERLKAEIERLRAQLPMPIVVLPSDEEPAPEPEPEPVEELPAEPAPEPPKRETAVIHGELKPGKGLDVGTVNLVAAASLPGGEAELRTQRNVFIDVEITAYTKAMLTKLNVPYVVQGKRMYVLGEPAFQLANVLNRRTRRPMKDGLISPKEQDALPIMKLMIGSILGEPRAQDEVCFYSVPGDPVDSDLSVAYHRDLFDAVLKSLGYKPSHILEGHAVTFAELGEDDFTGIGVSCGGGMFNVCVAYKSMPALTFSTSRSGDWVDMNVAQALGIKPEKAAQLKEQGVDLMAPKTREEDAISIYYRNLINFNVSQIAERFRAAENMPTFSEPVPVVFSGGTALAGNFIELVRDVFSKVDFPIPVKEIRLAKDALNATAKGALVAAQLEMANRPS